MEIEFNGKLRSTLRVNIEHDLAVHLIAPGALRTRIRGVEHRV